MSKKILFWTSSYRPVMGGLQVAVSEIAKHVSSKGYEARILANKYPKFLKSTEKIDNIQVDRFLFISSLNAIIKNRRIDLIIAYIFYKPFTLLKLIAYFFKHKPHIVNLHFPDIQLFECLVLKYIFNFKLIVSLHGDEVTRMNTMKRTSIKRALYQALFNNSEYITTCSESLLSEFLSIFHGIKRKKCIVVHNGVSDIFLNNKVEEKKSGVVFSAARFVHKKGIDLLLDAFYNVDNYKLIVAGGYSQDLDKATLLKLGENTELIGKVTSEKIVEYLTSSMVTVIPSRAEPYGIFVAEALCSGSPVVTTNVGGIPEVISRAIKGLSAEQIEIFYEWVKVVEPNTGCMKDGFDAIISNRQDICDYLSIIEIIREGFSWDESLVKYDKIINSL